MDDFTDEMIKHLKGHSELLEQRQGMDIMQNFFVINPQERQVSFRNAMINLKNKKQETLDKGLLTALKSKVIIRSHINIIDNFLETFPDERKPRSGLDIPKMRKLAVENAELILESLTMLINDYEKDIETVPDLKEELQDSLDAAYHVLKDFSILLKIKFPTSTPYLREFKEKYKID